MIGSKRSPLMTAGMYGLLLLFIVFLAFPLVWLISTSLKGPQELVALDPSVIPRAPTLDNYIAAFQEQDLVRAAVNSAIVAGTTAFLTVLIVLPGAYAMVRFTGRIQKVSMGWIVVSQVFPLILIIIPLFLVLRDLRLLNTLYGLILVYLVWSLPFTLWMLMSYVRAIPVDLEEAGMVDGCGRLGVIRRIVLPLLAPGLVVVLMFAFIASWNEFFLALVVLQDPELTTIPVRLARFVGSEGVVRLGPLAAAALIATIPSLVIFTLLQGRITQGLMAGGVKG